MQNVATFTQRRATDYAARQETLNKALERLLTQIFGCYHRDLSRPFTHNNKTYRVCMSCGMGRSFDLKTWKTFGPVTQIR